ncbi:hypothetical protein PCASD_21291 [Puccinia coronata f. sp. avenae]|uniref:Uncharacterized protein n=1 Tax=Puccinia coronata f. sp. avenae TaxID=200324 RepID=A0A2N5TX40_9BASI|nr:hypothetical protein PCASD_21291 [Puccinia coronata f. sp. avenae]
MQAVFGGHVYVVKVHRNPANAWWSCATVVDVDVGKTVQIQIVPQNHTIFGQIEMLRRGDQIRIAGVSAQGVCQQDGVIKVKFSVKII